jgi:hypothetical protein
LEKQQRQLSDAKQKLITKHDLQVQELKTEHSIRVKELEDRVQTLTEAHDRTCREVQQLLTEQRLLADRW